MDIDAAGPEVFSFQEYVALLAKACSVKRAMISLPNWFSLTTVKALGLALNDIILTREELLGLQQELLLSLNAPTGHNSVSDWLLATGSSFGKTYINDLDRHFRGKRQQAVGAV